MTRKRTSISGYVLIIVVHVLPFNQIFQKDDSGKMLYTRVCELMQLEERDYFGLTFFNSDNNRVSLQCVSRPPILISPSSKR